MLPELLRLPPSSTSRPVITPNLTHRRKRPQIDPRESNMTSGVLVVFEGQEQTRLLLDVHGPFLTPFTGHDASTPTRPYTLQANTLPHAQTPKRLYAQTPPPNPDASKPRRPHAHAHTTPPRPPLLHASTPTRLHALATRPYTHKPTHFHTPRRPNASTPRRLQTQTPPNPDTHTPTRPHASTTTRPYIDPFESPMFVRVMPTEKDRIFFKEFNGS
ncbi:proteoglycan 4-like [Homarus americanus]|uniref:proteoglycan 4-like n=1 Tax=Homarus americanus TaxID=6706 RepID=UPI001C485988|nr:proteoglycan 4-like [Homarus americanus]